MARLVARALRLGRSALIQTGVPCHYQGRHHLSYLVPLLMWPGPAILVAPTSLLQRLLRVEIPRLQEWMGTPKAIRYGNSWPNANFDGLFLTSPDCWLQDRLQGQLKFPTGIPTILDRVDDLEVWVRQQLNVCIQPADWEELMLAFPHQLETIRDIRVKLIKAVFEHPQNPYECCSIEDSALKILQHLYESLPIDSFLALPDTWRMFAECFDSSQSLIWAEISRCQGQFSLFGGPVAVADALRSVWQQQPVVLIGAAVELEASAPIYRASIGLGDVTTLKFSPDRYSELIHLYCPEGIPLPNTSQFQKSLLPEVRSLIAMSAEAKGLTVLLVGDMPLKTQVGSVLAGEFGSRVQVEKTCLDDNGILVTGWEFWRQHQAVMPAPILLAIATLPIPSLEHPLVAGRVADYKRQRLDWFRLYLLPVALRELQWAIAPVRDCQGIVALFDRRVLHRSYGQQVLAALEPLARINYLDASWFANRDIERSLS